MIGFPKLGASASRVVRGITVSKTACLKCSRTSATTCCDRRVRPSNMVITTPSRLSDGLIPLSRS